MQLQTKALYNLIRFNLAQGQEVQCEPWQSQDLTLLSEQDLFSLIKDFGFNIDEEQFITFAKDAESPEALAEFLVEESNDVSKYDRLYLPIFELWKRYFPEQKTLSIYADELDHLIFLYDNDQIKSDEPIQDALESLKEILEENVDEGQDPKEAWSLIAQYCAHDLSSFLYDYISELIDTGHEIYASELIEAFYPFVGDRWFDFLQIRTLNFIDADEQIIALVASLSKKPDYELQISILDYLAETENPDLFHKLLKHTIKQTEETESLLDLIEISKDFYHNYDQEDKVQKLEELENIVQKSKDFIPKHIESFLNLIK